MLPLIQTHQPVQQPLDSLGGLQDHGHGKPDYIFHYHRSRPVPSAHHTNSTPRTFAIRTSQQPPSLHRITTTFTRAHGHDHAAEHSLRRKTPSGTIDNGYDGSHLVSGPPPLKQMILPASCDIFPTAVVDRAPAPSLSNFPRPPQMGGWPYTATGQVPKMNMDAAGTSASATRVWGMDPSTTFQNPGSADAASQMAMMPQQSYQAASVHGLIGPNYQQPLASPAFVGYAQPGPWGGANPSGYRTAIPLANGYTPQNAVVDSAFMPTQATIHHGFPNGSGIGQAHPFRPPLPSRPIDDGFARYGHSGMHTPVHRLQALTLNSPGSLIKNEPSSPAQFKERALQHAHKAYNDLLVYLSHTKKAHHGRTGSHSRPANKMVVYPKPPKTFSTTENSTKARTPAYADATASYSQHLAQKEAAARAAGFGGHGGAHGRAVVANPTIAAEILSNSTAAYSSKPLRGFPEIGGSPLLNARTSLDMLSNLCEMGGWKWVDGMLLGGCLHYGLEHYEEALEWFRRIVGLEKNHVEAISNIAATLYCLGRQEEAEHHWIQAVRLRPSYLEAVEHLVGLFCSNHRSQEAVTTIEFVQQSLRMPGLAGVRDRPNETKNGWKNESTSASGADGVGAEMPSNSQLTATKAAGSSSRQPGFGSSGYAIPGSENGRMILIIHAKGNMLYALKDIDRAAEAFEEAVLISAGREVKGVHALIWRIQSVLSPVDPQSAPLGATQRNLSAPLLLPPEKAKHTAQLVFAPSHGQLPGLQFVPDGSHRKTAVSTTSNSLLSLAKIFQDAMSNGGPTAGLIRQPAGVGDILALYYLSLSLQESPSTANNVGILLASVPQSSTQQVSVPEFSVPTTIPGIVPGSGLSLALAYYRYGLSLDQKHVHLHTNLGSLLKDIGQLDLAIQMYEKAVACDASFDIALTNLANAVKDRGRISEAIHYYKQAVNSNPEFAEAVCGLSTALSSVCDWRGRGGVLLSRGKYDRWHVDEDGMLRDVTQHGQGGGLMKRVVEIVGRQLKESSSWGRGALQEQTISQIVSQLQLAGSGTTDGSLNVEAELRKWSGMPWEGSRVLRLIERSTRAAMRCWYQDKYVKGIQSASGYPRPKPPANLSIPSAPTVLPFHTFTCPLTAKDIRMISQRNALRISCSTLRSPWIPNIVYEPPKPPSPHLNVGYVSSDFNNHPLAHLMQSVFGFHDQKRVKAFCYATTASDKSIHRQQIEREAPVFRDVSTWTSDRLVDQIVKDDIHILVNLNGYTRGARNEIFAARPAPIQMSFMGFAGTLGAEWCDYLLADATAIPPSTLRPHRNNLNLEDVFRDEADAESEDWVYSENIVFCRDTFFCCDHAQSADGSNDRDMTWEAEQQRRWKMRKELFPGLRDDVIILGNFNQLYKIDPTTFRTWLRILAAVPNAVLWLLRFPELGETHLRRTAKAWAGEGVASRIIFTDVAPKQQHISRARVCDLFLDTPECNAHTTAADILWSSTPLLTLPRYDYKMCSRMAASILKGALPKGPEGDRAAQELIAADDSQYEDFAIKLASGLQYDISKGYGEGMGRLAELRKLLWASKWTCALFDTRRWVRDLEEAYEEAWRRWVSGESGDIYL
ncbi:putative UDP-N-acetylglucosamine--peptide N-acetylglucosaminyltransferase SEC [Podospora aff. communis PSN243]|uniref:protein O-GlcNAc transferase n=1 Tax=Podospora aff. communis PSN243 TaxID=3040156 RepID=A0AAV9GL95_9PEZI|nr:putative UDP-N-acetylglucosamine--peptide N-acetylglucosaminyltransferase SEC [Podospora aff. communis PSN243]